MWYFSRPARMWSNASSTLSANCNILYSSSLMVPQLTMAFQFSTLSQYLRPLQVDYLLTRFKEGTPNNQTQNNLRASTGIVIHF